MPPERLRIFISSPGDVAEERVLANNLVRRLADEFAHRLWIEPVFWEHEPLLATDTFQKQIPPPRECQVAICILWSRLGTRLPANITRTDGSRYASGTEYEFEDAAEEFRRSGRPQLLVYRKTATPLVSLDDDEALDRRRQQKKALDLFVQKWFFHAEDGTLKAAFHAFANTAEFEKVLEEHLRKLIARRLELIPPTSADAVPSKISWTSGSPFRGLEAFDYQHAPVFFGRTQAIGDVLAALRKNAAAGKAFLLVLGASGGGKSSLIRAGVLPLLTQPGVIEGVGLWRRAIFRPSDAGGDLLRALASALLDTNALPELASDGTTSDQLRAMLSQNPAAAFSLIKGGLSQAASALPKDQSAPQQPEARLVLVVDQLEELFTLKNVTNQDRQTFIAVISSLAHSGKVFVIGTLRGDFYHRCFELPELGALKEGAGQFDLALPSGAEIGQMIRQPARAAGLSFEENPQTKVRLDDLLVEAASRSSESLPLMEFALELLYQRKTPEGLLTFEAYRELGGVEGALAKRAEEVFAALPPDVQATLPRVMRELVNVPEGGTATRQQATLHAVAPTPQSQELVDAFVQARLFSADRTVDGTAVVRVAHEALLANWPRAREWLEQNREILIVRGRVIAAAARWQREGRLSDLLLSEGKPLAEAQNLAAKLGDDLPEEARSLIAASIARRQRRNLLKCSAIAALVLLTVAIGIQKKRFDRQQVINALMAETEARHAASNADFALASNEMQKNNMRVALAYLAEALRQDPSNEKATALAVSILGGCPLPSISLRHGDEVHDARFSPDGTRLVTASADGTARLWDARSGQPIGEPMRHQEGKWVHRAAFSPDGNWIVTASWDGTARVWDAHTAQPRISPQNGGPVVMKHTDRVTAAIFSPDGRWVLTACFDHRARLWDAQTGQQLGDPQTHERVEMRHDGIVWTAAFSPDGQRVVTASADRTARVWDAHTGRPIMTPQNKEMVLRHNDEVNGASFSPDGRWIVTGSDDGYAKVWNAQSGEEQKHVNELGKPIEMRHALAVNPPSFSPDSRCIVTASDDKTAQIWDARTGKPVGQPMRHQGWVRIAHFSPDGRLVVTASYDGTARVWDAQTCRPLSNPMYHGSAVYDADFSADGKYLVTASFDHSARVWLVQKDQVKIPMDHENWVTSARFSLNDNWVVTTSGNQACVWDAHTGEPRRKQNGSRPVVMLHPDTATVTSARFSPDDKRVLTAATDGSARLWDAQSGEMVWQTTRIGASEHAYEVKVADFSPDGHSIVTSHGDGSVRLWNAQTGHALTPPGSDQQVALKLSEKFNFHTAFFSPDNKWVLTASADGMARILDARTGEVLKELAHNGGVESARYSQDGTWIVTASDDHYARVWNSQTGQLVGTSMRHDGWVYDAEFSPDGQRVVTASMDGTARVWDRQTGQGVTRLMRHGDAIKSARFSPDGKWLVTASADATARIWDARTGLPVSEPLRHLGDVTAARFSHDGKWVLTASADHTAQIWGAPTTKEHAPDWLIELIEEVGGLELDGHGNMQPVEHDVIDFRKRFGGLADSDDLSHFGRWLVADPATRTISPRLQMTVPEFVSRRLQENTELSVEEAYYANPGNPVVLAILAKFKFESDHEKALFYCCLALQRARAAGSQEQITQVLAIAKSLFPGSSEFRGDAGLSPLAP